MDGNLSKRQIKTIAAIHSAIHLSYVDIMMFNECSVVSDSDQEKIITEINVIASKISLGLPMNLGTTQEIVNYVKEKY